MRKLRSFFLAALICISFAACQRSGLVRPAPTPGNSSGSLTIGGLTRSYLLHLPPAYDGSRSLPLVLALHGAGGDGQGMAKLTHLSTLADQQGFLVVYPDGYQKHWADGRGVTAPDQAGVDDVGFLSALIDRLASQFKIDTRRVYVTGISNGGFMTERLACDLARKIAAVAAVAATMPDGLAARCAPGRPVPFMLIQGTADPLVPANGGMLGEEHGQVISAAATLQRWAALDSCSPPAQSGDVPDRVNDGTHVSFQRYTTCQQHAQAALYLIEGGGHTWPGGIQYLPAAIIGKTSRQIDASQVIWSFLNQFALGQA